MRQAHVLFSEGSDSTLAAAWYAEQGYKVQLVTIDRNQKSCLIEKHKTNQSSINSVRRKS